MIGIEPCSTNTTSATLRPCEAEIAEVTSFLTLASFRIRSSRVASPFLSSAMATSFSVPSSGTASATQRPRVISWIVASMSSGEWLRPYTIKRSLIRPTMNNRLRERSPTPRFAAMAPRECLTRDL